MCKTDFLCIIVYHHRMLIYKVVSFWREKLYLPFRYGLTQKKILCSEYLKEVKMFQADTL
jgi:hypothetical protein